MLHFINTIVKKPVFRIVLLLTVVIMGFSCSDEDDMRDGVLQSYGEPDIKDKGGSGAYKYERWFYLHRDVDRMYLFRKSASGCGSEGNWYVEYIEYAHYYYELYEPPTIKHSPVISAPAGQALRISAQVSDDIYVLDVSLSYRKTGEEEYTLVSMAPQDSVFVSTIPADQMTAAGVQYYISAYDDEEHDSQLPKKGEYTIDISPDYTEVTYGSLQTARKRIPVDADRSMGFSSPLSP